MARQLLISLQDNMAIFLKFSDQVKGLREPCHYAVRFDGVCICSEEGWPSNARHIALL